MRERGRERERGSERDWEGRRVRDRGEGGRELGRDIEHFNYVT